MFGIMRLWRHWRRMRAILRSGKIKMDHRPDPPSIRETFEGSAVPKGQLVCEIVGFTVRIGDGVTTQLADLPIHWPLTNFIQAEIRGDIVERDRAASALSDEYTPYELSMIARQVCLWVGVKPRMHGDSEDLKELRQSSQED